MSTIASLMLELGRGGPSPYGDIQAQTARTRQGELSNETALLTLADLKRKQASEQEVLAFFQQHPELIAGLQQGQQGGQVPILATLGQPQPGGPGGPPGAGPLMQQTTMPGQPPGAPQVVPGGQDLSRFANVSPQGGGPIPPDVMAQTMPTVTPPQGMPPRATLGQPQAPQNPLMELVRRDPRAGLLAQQQMQAQQQFQSKLEEQRLDWTSKKMGYFGQVLQGVNSPESYGLAVQEIARVDPQAAARLPQTYSKEALIPYIKQATTVKENADLQIRTMHEQTEAAKLGIQLQNAGYQGLGAPVIDILRGLSEEQVTKFGGRTSAPAVKFATDEVQRIEIEKREKEGLAGAQATAQASREARQQQTLSEAFKGETVNLYDTQTGRPLPSRMKIADYEQLPQTQVAQLSDDNRKQMENVNSAMPRLQILQTHIDAVYGPGGVLERMSPADRELVRSPLAIPIQISEQFAQKYPELAAARKYIDANAESLARALSGVKGAATEADVERAKSMLPNLTAALKVWPLSEAGLSLPDTRETALRTMNNLVDTLNGIGTGILGNPEYRTPLKKYENPENVPGPGLRKGEGSVRITPSNAPRQAPRGSTPPAPQPPAAAVPAPGAPIFPPAPAIRIPGETAAPATPPTPPTATSTPAQDEAYRQSQGQGRPTAPAAPTPRPTPGRQSQAPAGTRLAGAPKFMELRDVQEAMRQTGKSRREVEAAARSKGYTVYGSRLPLAEETAIG